MPNALVITAAGINCDAELARAFRQAGAIVETWHLNQLIAQPELIDRFDLIGLPGGFSYGDAVAAGRVMAALLRQSLYQPLIRAIDRGVPIIAPCNGFQIAVQAGLLPGPIGASTSGWPDAPATPRVALTRNASARFVDRWCRIEVPETTRCIWTQGLTMSEHTAVLPIAHGEGRFVAASDDLLDELESSGQIALTYAPGENPNGSARHVAGICDPSGLVFGLMPHPERYTAWTQHPTSTRLTASEVAGDPLGLQMFRNAVQYVTSHQLSSVTTSERP